ncbi:MAG: YybH family protein [Terriglobales bacterium]
MKFSIYSVLVLSLLAATLAQAQSDRSAEQQILPLMHEQMLAAKAHDTDRFLATYAHDSTLVFVINGQVIRGYDSLREQQLKWWSQGKSDVVYTQQAPPQFMQLGPKTVLVTAELASRRTLPDGKTSEGTFAVTSIWQRLSDGWRVVYAHESWTR